MAVESSSQLGMALADQAPHHSEMCSYTQQELLITGCNFRDLYMFLRSKKNEYISKAHKMHTEEYTPYLCFWVQLICLGEI